MPASDEQLQMRDRVWERICERVSIHKGDANFFFPSEPNYVDVRAFADQLLREFPGSGLEANQIAVEFHKMWRIARDRASRPSDPDAA
jgi:hypothetical protein